MKTPHAVEGRKRQAPRNSKGADPPAGPERFSIDRETLEHLKTPIHRAVAEKLIAEGSWILVDGQEEKVTT